MKKINKKIPLFVLLLISVVFLSGIVAASDLSADDMTDESSSALNDDIAAASQNQISAPNKATDNDIQEDTKDTSKTNGPKGAAKLQTIYVNSQASQSNTGEDRSNPTTLNNAVNNIADGGTIYLITDLPYDTYNLTSAISISRYSNNINSLNIVGEENKDITISGNNNTQILNIYSTAVNISNINFKDTQLDSSSSIYASSSTLNFFNCSFVNNQRKDYGASIYASYSTIRLNNCIVSNNTAEYGGAIYLSRSNMTADLSEFNDNSAFSGAAICALNSNLMINSSSYTGNNASFGASIYNYKSNITCDNARFINNTALYYGGAIIHLSEGKTNINNSQFISNKAINGGSLYVMQSDVTVTYSVFENNTAQSASGLYLYNNTVHIKNNCLVGDNLNDSLISILYPKSYLLDENWWGVNNPDFFSLTGGYIPDTWVLMTFKNYTSTQQDKLNLSVSINQLSAQDTLRTPIPTRKVYFSADSGVFDNDVMDISTSITNGYVGDSTIYARIDNQLLQLNAKVVPSLLVENYTTNESSINLTITANKDISGTFELTINDYTTRLTAKQKTRLYYPISDLAPGEYAINLTYRGNTKYDNSSIISYLVVQSNNYTQNETIIATLTKENISPTELPSRYSLLDLDLLTPVKSQGSAGSCVSFATIGVIESSLKKFTNITYDLSENNLKNMFKKYSILGLSSLEPNDGGYDMEPVGYMASGFGPVLEDIDRYNTQSHISNIFEPLIQVQNIYFIPARNNFVDNDQIKQAIMKYGALYTGVKLSSSLNQYNIGVNQSTHAVCIVGWDDNYSRTHFSPNAPGDGAFIIKNSWGENTGNNGYQYVSYYDSVIGNIPYVGDYNSLNFVVDCDNVYNYSNIYQYDSVVYVYKLGDNDGQYWINNSYTIQKDEVIAAVGTYFVDDSEYEVKVYVNNNLVTTKSAKLTQAGYQTIQLDNLYRVRKNDEVMVVIGIKQNISRSYIYVPLHDNEYPILSANPKSFISYTGLQYENLKDQDTVAPIKVYTMDVAEFDTEVDVELATIRITTNITNLDSDAKLCYKINGEFIKDSDDNIIFMDLTDSDSIVEFTYATDTLTGSNATLESILSYKGLNITKSLEFNPRKEIRLEIDNITAYLNTPVSITVNVTNQDNEKLTGGYVVFTDTNGDILGQSDVNEGISTIYLTFDGEREDMLSVTYFDDNGELLAENTTSLTVKKHDVIIHIDDISANPGETIALTATLTDEAGSNIDNGKVTFKINGKTLKDTNGKVIYVKVVDGVASTQYTLPGNISGTDLKVQVIYSGSSKYDSEKNESTISVNPLIPVLRCEDITAGKSSQITLKAWINEGDNSITNAKVVFKINGKTVKDENNKVIYAKVVNGAVAVDYVLPDSMNPKNYTITAVLISSDYPRIEDTATLTIV